MQSTSLKLYVCTMHNNCVRSLVAEKICSPRNFPIVNNADQAKRGAKVCVCVLCACVCVSCVSLPLILLTAHDSEYSDSLYYYYGAINLRERQDPEIALSSTHEKQGQVNREIPPVVDLKKTENIMRCEHAVRGFFFFVLKTGPVIFALEI